MRARIRSSKGLDQRIQRNAVGQMIGVRATTPADGGTGPSRPKSRPGEAIWEATVRRDALGLEIERTLPGGVQSRWDRDNVGRPVKQEVWSAGTFRKAVQYTWDVDDRLKMVIDATRGPIRYEHDRLGNLAAATYVDGRVDLRMPDAVGNLFRTAARGDRKYGPAGQLLEARKPDGSTTRYDYDAEGNLVSKVESDAGGVVVGTWTYAWNGAGMLSAVERPDGETVRFAYDALGRRLSKTFGVSVTRWIWDGHVPLHEWVESGGAAAEPASDLSPADEKKLDEVAAKRRQAALAARPAQGPPGAPALLPPSPDRGTREAPITWLFDPETFAPMGKLVGNARYAIITDHLGTPTAMYDAAGTEVWSASIDIYGNLRDIAGDKQACPFRWPGQYEDAETGLYYNRFRYYDPVAAGYTSQDPLRLAGGFRLSGYVLDPNSAIDPLGLSGCKDIPTPYGPATQSATAEAISARAEVQAGARLYRVGTLAKSETELAQFWALEHPLSAGYASRYGIPAGNVANADFIETAFLKPNSPFVTRVAPGVGSNLGGGIEVVVPPAGVQMASLSTKGAGW
jgi:RHS repeat-associated protein